MDFSKMGISEMIRVAREQAEIERDTPSLIDADSDEQHASWASTLTVVEHIKEHGVREPLKNSTTEGAE